MLGFVKHLESLRPLLAPHVNDAEIGIGPGDLRIKSRPLPKGAFGLVELSASKSVLPVLKDLRRIAASASRRRCRRRTVAWRNPCSRLQILPQCGRCRAQQKQRGEEPQ